MSENKRFYLDETGINDREYEFGLLGEDELVDIINELNDFKDNVFKVIDKKIEWHLLQAKKCRNQGDIKKAIKFEEAIMTLNILKRDIKKLKELEE